MGRSNRPPRPPKLGKRSPRPKTLWINKPEPCAVTCSSQDSAFAAESDTYLNDDTCSDSTTVFGSVQDDNDADFPKLCPPMYSLDYLDFFGLNPLYNDDDAMSSKLCPLVDSQEHNANGASHSENLKMIGCVPSAMTCGGSTVSTSCNGSVSLENHMNEEDPVNSLPQQLHQGSNLVYNDDNALSSKLSPLVGSRASHLENLKMIGCVPFAMTCGGSTVSTSCNGSVSLENHMNEEDPVNSLPQQLHQGLNLVYNDDDAMSSKLCSLVDSQEHNANGASNLENLKMIGYVPFAMTCGGSTVSTSCNGSVSIENHMNEEDPVNSLPQQLHQGLNLVYNDDDARSSKLCPLVDSQEHNANGVSHLENLEMIEEYLSEAEWCGYQRSVTGCVPFAMTCGGSTVSASCNGSVSLENHMNEEDPVDSLPQQVHQGSNPLYNDDDAMSSKSCPLMDSRASHLENLEMIEEYLSEEYLSEAEWCGYQRSVTGCVPFAMICGGSTVSASCNGSVSLENHMNEEDPVDSLPQQLYQDKKGEDSDHAVTCQTSEISNSYKETTVNDDKASRPDTSVDLRNISNSIERDYNKETSQSDENGELKDHAAKQKSSEISNSCKETYVNNDEAFRPDASVNPRNISTSIEMDNSEETSQPGELCDRLLPTMVLDKGKTQASVYNSLEIGLSSSHPQIEHSMLGSRLPPKVTFEVTMPRFCVKAPETASDDLLKEVILQKVTAMELQTNVSIASCNNSMAAIICSEGNGSPDSVPGCHKVKASKSKKRPVMDVNSLDVSPVAKKSKSSKIEKRRKTLFFSVSEVEALVQQVEEHGTGSWAKIKEQAFGQDSRRTRMDLRDKWESLLKTAEMPVEKRRGQKPTQELLDRVLAIKTRNSQLEDLQS